MFQEESKDKYSKFNAVMSDIEDIAKDSLKRLEYDKEKIRNIKDKLELVDDDLDNGNKMVSNMSWNNFYTKIGLLIFIMFLITVVAIIAYIIIKPYVSKS